MEICITPLAEQIGDDRRHRNVCAPRAIHIFRTVIIFIPSLSVAFGSAVGTPGCNKVALCDVVSEKHNYALCEDSTAHSTQHTLGR